MSYIYTRSAVDWWVRFTMPISGIVTVQYDIRTTDKSGGVIISNPLDSNAYRVAWQDNSVSTQIRVANFYINNVLVFGTVTTRDQLADLICTGDWITVKYRGFSNSLADFSTPWSAGVALELANYSSSVTFCPNADLRNFKIDIGDTGTWQYESELGDTNGFTRQNIIAIKDTTRRRRYAGGFGL